LISVEDLGGNCYKLTRLHRVKRKGSCWARWIISKISPNSESEVSGPNEIILSPQNLTEEEKASWELAAQETTELRQEVSCLREETADLQEQMARLREESARRDEEISRLQHRPKCVVPEHRVLDDELEAMKAQVEINKQLLAELGEKDGKGEPS
jgi:septal ring factor EnvC (AmiA/AmiB activator)